MIYYPPKKGTASRQSNSPLADELVCFSAERHGNLEQRGCWEGQIMLATACQTRHLVREVMASDPLDLQIHSRSLFS